MSKENTSLLIKNKNYNKNTNQNNNNGSGIDIINNSEDNETGGGNRTTYGTIIEQHQNNNSNSNSSIENDDNSTLTIPSESIANIYSSGGFPGDEMKSTLSFFNKIGFGLGHVYNDLCAGVWFSYTLLFMQGALLIPSTLAGALVMLGQIGDAIATPIVGYMADKYGTKRKWHLFGTALVFCSFPLIFSFCPYCNVFPVWWQSTYFGMTILLFQLGWAIVQITHLAIIPEMSRTQKDRADLTAIRYSASVCSNVIVYIVTWAILHARNKSDNNIGPSDAYRFRDISLILTLIGVSMTVLFHFSLSLSGYSIRRQQAISNQIKRRRRSSSGSQNNSIRRRRNSNVEDPLINTNNDDGEYLIRQSSSNNNNNIDTTTETSIILPASVDGEPQHIKKNFFKTPLLYQNAFLYVFSRLFMTTALIYMPLWLDERSWTPLLPASEPSFPRQYNNIMRMNSSSSSMDLLSNAADDNGKSVEHIATVPLVSFLASFLASMALKYTNQYVGHQFEYLFGSITSICVCTWIAFAVSPTASTITLYGIAILFGIGSSITMISSLCITADMIGAHADQSGFIYSAVTFADKLITGIVIVVIESLKCQDRQECPEYYRNVLAYACGISAIFGLFTLTTLQCNRRQQRPQERRRSDENIQ